ncbi:substrate-binding domain-containing protein [Allostreptomyces psammosilenae]|uniref:Ribose transport system substrate-binding protein n=1 Tax=Allostreptomyces psammosilenae TaxID=1892865 RepID=A0A852ZXF7_9ACTN|nr:substrate-binding domain-containing protein [Allostreptomyces psammosilenae]NYI06705.1 ribose transport system substrate-binding protein [Allostreptomyces psammosilenae]
MSLSDRPTPDLPSLDATPSRPARAAGRRGFLLGSAAIGAGALLAGCTSNEVGTDDAAAPAPAAEGSTSATGAPVTIGFAGPQADHGWLNAINEQARAEAERYPDVTLEVVEGTNDAAAQSGQIETLINRGVDVIVILPADGKAMTQSGLAAMQAGIPVVNLDRIFDTPRAYRLWIGGDNYGMGVSAGHFIGERLRDRPEARVVELAGIDNLELTQQRSQGFADALAEYPNIELVARQAAEFTVQSGQEKMAQLLQAVPQIDAVWNHDDDQGVGAEQAIRQAGRDEFIMVGGAGSRHVMDQIKADNTVIKATVLYPVTMAASAIACARLIAQSRALGDLRETEVPTSITLHSAVVTKENVDRYLPIAFT